MSNISVSTDNLSDSDTGSNTIKTAVVDLIYVLATLFILKETLLQFPVMWTFAGPISLLSALGVAIWRLKLSGQSLKTIGFVQNQTKRSLVLWTVVALASTLILANVAVSLIGQLFELPSGTNEELSQAMSGRFSNVPGNLAVYAYWLVVAWVIGGFTEELLFRGFMLHRFEQAYKKLPFAIALAVITQALIFGQQHFYYQGLNGFIATGIVGLLSGTIYVYCNRRLWPLILSHGLVNTLGFTLIYLNINL